MKENFGEDIMRIALLATNLLFKKIDLLFLMKIDIIRYFKLSYSTQIRDLIYINILIYSYWLLNFQHRIENSFSFIHPYPPI